MGVATRRLRSLPRAHVDDEEANAVQPSAHDVQAHEAGDEKIDVAVAWHLHRLVHGLPAPAVRAGCPITCGLTWPGMVHSFGRHVRLRPNDGRIHFATSRHTLRTGLIEIVVKAVGQHFDEQGGLASPEAFPAFVERMDLGVQMGIFETLLQSFRSAVGRFDHVHLRRFRWPVPEGEAQAQGQDQREAVNPKQRLRLAIEFAHPGQEQLKQGMHHHGRRAIRDHQVSTSNPWKTTSTCLVVGTRFVVSFPLVQSRWLAWLAG